MVFLLLYTFLDGNIHHRSLVSGITILTFIQTITDHLLSLVQSYERKEKG